MSTHARAYSFLARGVALGAAATASGLLLHASSVAAPQLVAATPAQAIDEEPDTFDDLELATTAQFFLARDPFKPIRPQTTEGGGGGATGATGGEGTGGGTTDPDPEPATGGGGGSTTDDPCTEGAEVVCDGDVVTLVAVDGDAVVVRVSTAVYTVVVGQTFADNYQLTSVDGSCASFLYGDDSFDLCIGEQILK